TSKTNVCDPIILAGISSTELPPYSVKTQDMFKGTYLGNALSYGTIKYTNMCQRNNTPMLIGYARASTPEHSLDLQKDVLNAAQCELIYDDVASDITWSLPYARYDDLVNHPFLGKMGSISDLNYQTLHTTANNFLRPETLRAANDRVSNAMAQLPIFRHYDIEEEIHSSSDGQKFETQCSTLRSRHSPKYFGLKKGIAQYTLVANHVPINIRIFGANDHESHYVFDVLYNNPTDIRRTIHSTDTHGTNQVLERQGNQEQLDHIKRVSPVSWKHINFYGKYNFCEPSEGIDLTTMGWDGSAE
ncbi:MAG: Tn3 family transposase, partial [Firmicutes bacterium]|nr:Tn3 family transposase [Bacillota bacterium]